MYKYNLWQFLTDWIWKIKISSQDINATTGRKNMVSVLKTNIYKKKNLWYLSFVLCDK